MDYRQFFSADTASFMRSPVREVLKRYDLTQIYSLSGGYPAPETFPVETFSRLASEIMRKQGAKCFQYGATQGLTELRQVVSERYGIPMANVQITTSSQQGIDICSRILLDPGDVVLCSDPSYLGAIQSFKSYRADVVGISNPGGDAFREAWRSEIERQLGLGKRIKMAYMIPDFQNPSGESLSMGQRQALVDLAREYDFLIIEDAPYSELRYSGEPLPSMYSIDKERVVHLGSFSKIMAPGFRLGWMFASEEFLDQIFVCKQALDLCPPIFDQYLAAEFMGSGEMDRNLIRSIELYRRRRDFMMGLLKELMPEGVKWTSPEGGLFLFVSLPGGLDATAMYEKALDNKVAYVPGSFFSPSGAGRNTMRLNFSYMGEDKIEKGLRILSRLIREEMEARA